MTQKTLREDRTAAEKKLVAYCDPPQAENLASEILLNFKLLEYLKRKSTLVLVMGGAYTDKQENDSKREGKRNEKYF